MGTEPHDIILSWDFINGTWFPECSCGWEGIERDDKADALRNGHDHVFFEATETVMDEAAMNLSPPESPVHTPIPDDRFEIVKRTDTCTTIRMKKGTQ